MTFRTASGAIDANACLGVCDVLFMTLDSLRYDVAQDAWAAGETPNLAELLPPSGWERRHTPGSFTYAAHHAFFAGFLPTPATPRDRDAAAHERLFAARFPGSETTAARTLVFDAPDIVAGFAARGYHTVCVGGVGFFSKRSALGSALPNLFAESFWDESLGVSDPDSARNQMRLAAARVAAAAADRRLFLFVNVSACHQPTLFYLPGATEESSATQRAALRDVDRRLPTLLDALAARGPTLAILCSDHGVAYGEDGYHGLRLGHPAVWDAPYCETVLERREK